MELVAILSQLGIPAIVAAIVTGAYALMTKRSEHTRPDLLSQGYSTFVKDLRTELAGLKEEAQTLRDEVSDLRLEISDLKRDRGVEHRKVVVLEEQVAWLLSKLSEEEIIEFHKRFSVAGPIVEAEGASEALGER